jgi:hypothetical protein
LKKIIRNNSFNFRYVQNIIFAYERVIFKLSEHVKVKTNRIFGPPRVSVTFVSTIINHTTM